MQLISKSILPLFSHTSPSVFLYFRESSPPKPMLRSQPLLQEEDKDVEIRKVLEFETLLYKMLTEEDESPITFQLPCVFFRYRRDNILELCATQLYQGVLCFDGVLAHHNCIPSFLPGKRLCTAQRERKFTPKIRMGRACQSINTRAML